ncbi:heavy metal translocating P-type ATPase [Spirosoma endbachense]|uniref:HAD-IC family P-type ATPase n=1 Tax=Spirosoma endbachense TaxID=2666025 RepID=A0A6P1VSG0_9BACT|nr:heavy metal translocating P-type ATPase metal-binding domain-containing protein [Spirosoma endbachense]QHV95554.1 HAD-IC family P-type ATPase [Spirosoma endbachense]
MSTATIPSTSCYHCGNDCAGNNILVEDKRFCCEGCKTVYTILSQHQLCQYYTIESGEDGLRRGNMIKASNQSQSEQSRLVFLDHPDIIAQLLEFSNEAIAKVTFYIPTIHCSSCLWLLEHLYRIHPGIQQSRVDFLKKQVHFTYQPDKLTLRQLVELLSSIGYEPLISLNDVVKEQQQPSDRPLLYRLAVAGFCAGNIMLFSFPEYLGLNDPSFRQLFGILNILLALPVVIYSASGYFESVWKSLKKDIINIDFPILLGILVAFFRGTYEVLFLAGAGYFDSLTGLIFFLLCGKWFQQRTHDFLSFERDYKSYFPLAVTLLGRRAEQGMEGPIDKVAQQSPDTSFLTVNPISSVPEQIVLVSQLRKGDRIRIRNHELIPADGLLYKGKAMIDYSFVTGESEPEAKTPGALVYAGGKQLGEAIELEVVRDVSQSYLTQLWNNDAFRKGNSSRMLTFADIVGKYFTLMVIMVATLVGLYWYHEDPSRAINAFTAVLIIACPCALSLSYPFALGSGLRKLSQQKLYLKNAGVIEQMAACDTIVFDKTGTLTNTGQHDVQESFLQPLTAYERALIASLVRQSAHPLSRKLTAYLADSQSFSIDGFAEFSGHGVQGLVDGWFVKAGSRSFVNLDYNASTDTDDPAGATVHISIAQIYRGCFHFSSHYRAGIDTMLQNLRGPYRLYLLSGDTKAAQTQLKHWFPKAGQMHFNCRPQEKLAFIQHLQVRGRRVLMVGDGLNDAGALKQADVGMAVTDDTIQFTPASDAILEASSLNQLPDMLRYTRFGMRLIRFSFGISLLYNFVGLSYALTGSLSPVVAAILMPISSATMLAIATLGMRGYSRWKPTRMP